MEPQDFKARYLAHAHAACIDAPPGVLPDLLEFVSFEEAVLRKYRVGPKETHFLMTSGLPRSAAPFLNFCAYRETDLEELYASEFPPRSLFPLGVTGSGDPLGIELPSRAIVCLSHDDRMSRVFINSSIGQFAEALVCYQELRHSRQLQSFLENLERFDSAAAVEGAMWRGAVE